MSSSGKEYPQLLNLISKAIIVTKIPRNKEINVNKITKIKNLINQGCDLNIRDKYGKTALHCGLY